MRKKNTRRRKSGLARCSKGSRRIKGQCIEQTTMAIKQKLFDTKFNRF